MQYTPQHSAVECSTKVYIALLRCNCSAVQYKGVQCGTKVYSAVQRCTVQYKGVQCGAIAVQCSQVTFQQSRSQARIALDLIEMKQCSAA